MMQNKKFIYTIVSIIFWTLTTISMVFVFFKMLTPNYTSESIFTPYNITTKALHSGDQIIQPFSPSMKHLESFDVAIAYPETTSPDAEATIQLICDNTIIIEQPLQIVSIPNGSFLSLYAPIRDCKGKEMQIVVKNSSVDKTSSFSLLSTNESFLFLENTNDYLFNGNPQPERIFCRFSYLNGYTFYKGLTYSFLIFIVALLIYGKRKSIINRLNRKSSLP